VRQVRPGGHRPPLQNNRSHFNRASAKHFFPVAALYER